mgnify:CR=1 FL=1
MSAEPSQDLNHRVKEFARKVSKAVIADGFIPAGLHEYTDAQNRPVYWKVRLKHPAFDQAADAIKEKYQGKAKWIRALSQNADGIFQMKEPDFAIAYPEGNGKKPLYRLPDIVAAAPDAVVFIVEGEQKADALAALGLVATTSGGNTSTDTTYWQPLAGRSVRIWPDHDTAGQIYAREVKAALLALGCAVEVIDTDALNLEAKGDAVDWLAAHPKATAADVLALVVSAVVSSETAANDAPEERPAETEEQLIHRLAGLSSLAYFKVQKDTAKALGITCGQLDKLVNTERKKLQAEADASEGGSEILFEEVEPWPQPVNGAALLSELSLFLRRFVVCEPYTADAATLWIAFTWLIDAVSVAPIANITAPLPNCGKSTMLDFMERLAYRPFKCDGISPAALFRSVEKWRPTMLIDEVDAFLRDNEDARGVLNSGHKRNGYIIRVVGDTHEPRRFSTWGAKALCGIGAIASTLQSRSIRLELRRKLPDERVENLRHADDAVIDRLVRQLATLAEDIHAAVSAARPAPIPGLNNRAQDNWEPLLSIADAVGGEWPERARRVAQRIAGLEAANDAPDVNTMLLSDVKVAFERERTTKLFTSDLLDALCADEEAPWLTWNHGKKMTARQLASRLGEFGVSSGTIRIGVMTAKGYELDKFSDAFNRYLSFPPPASVTASQPLQDNGYSNNSIRHTSEDVTDKKTPKPLQHNECDVVTDGNGVKRDVSENVADGVEI